MPSLARLKTQALYIAGKETVKRLCLKSHDLRLDEVSTAPQDGQNMVFASLTAITQITARAFQRGEIRNKCRQSIAPWPYPQTTQIVLNKL